MSIFTIANPGLGNLATYRHYLTIGSTRTEVFPLNFLASSLNDELEKENVFYRRKFNGKLTFVNTNGDDDFDLLYLIEGTELCTKLIYEIERDGVAYWNGYFATADGEFDLTKCTFEVTPSMDDDYATLLDNADTKYNILDVTTIVTTAATRGSISKTYTHNRWLIDVITFLADKIKPGVNVTSTFFTAANNPATGVVNHLLYLTIAQKSDIIRPTSTSPAKTAMMSWNELMDILIGMFQLKWNYNSATNTINVEHISTFTFTDGLDLTTQLINKAANKFIYLKERMPKYEKITFMEADNDNFIGQPIWYDSKCVNQDPESNTKDMPVNVTTDLEYIVNNPEAIDDEGFVILCNYRVWGMAGWEYHVETGIGILSTEAKLNMHLSVSNLQDKYFRHGRVLKEGYMNGTLTDFYTAQKNKKQECFAIVCPGDSYDPDDEITTELGETYFDGAKAKVQTSQLSPSGEMKFSLLYGPPDTAMTPIPDAKVIYVWQDGVDTFHAVLSEPADADLVLGMQELLYDATCTLNCTGVAETWTIPTGEITGTFTFADLCHSFDVEWSMGLIIDISALPAGWTLPIYDLDPTVSVAILCP